MKKGLFFLLLSGIIAFVISSCSGSKKEISHPNPPPPPPPSDSFYTKLNGPATLSMKKGVKRIVLDYTYHVKKGVKNFVATELYYGIYGTSIDYMPDSMFCYDATDQLVWSEKLNSNDLGIKTNIAMNDGVNYRITVSGYSEKTGMLQVNGGSSYSINGAAQPVATWTARPGPIITVSD